MRRGSVIIDLAAPGGGNCELTQPGETIDHNGVTIFAPMNLPATIPVHASQLYSKNMTNFLQVLVKKGQLTDRHERRDRERFMRRAIKVRS